MTLQRDMEQLRRVLGAEDSEGPQSEEFTGPDGRMWCAVGLRGGPAIYLPSRKEGANDASR